MALRWEAFQVKTVLYDCQPCSEKTTFLQTTQSVVGEVCANEAVWSRLAPRFDASSNETYTLVGDEEVRAANIEITCNGELYDGVAVLATNSRLTSDMDKRQLINTAFLLSGRTSMKQASLIEALVAKAPSFCSRAHLHEDLRVSKRILFAIDLSGAALAPWPPFCQIVNLEGTQGQATAFTATAVLPAPACENANLPLLPPVMPVTLSAADSFNTRAGIARGAALVESVADVRVAGDSTSHDVNTNYNDGVASATLFDPTCSRETALFSRCVEANDDLGRCGTEQRLYMECQRLSDQLENPGGGGVGSSINQHDAAFQPSSSFAFRAKSEKVMAQAAAKACRSAPLPSVPIAGPKNFATAGCPPGTLIQPLGIPSMPPIPGPFGPNLGAIGGVILACMINGIMGDAIRDSVEKVSVLIAKIIPPILHIVEVAGVYNPLVRSTSRVCSWP